MLNQKASLLRAPFQGLQQSATLAINEQSAQLERAGQRVIKLGLGQSPFPVPDVVVERLRSAATEKDYLPVQGLKSLRIAIADWHYRTHNLHFDPDNILIGPGSKELLFLLQLVSDTQTYLPNPSWVSYAPQQQMTGRNVRWIPTLADNHFMLDSTNLEQHLRPHEKPLLVLNSPSNPVGRMLDIPAVSKIAEVMKRHNGIILSDEIYGEVGFNARHHSPAHDYPEGTIISGGLSKWCGAGGWRLGYLAFPSNLKTILEAMCVAASETFTSVSAPIQYAAIAAYEPHDQITEYLGNSQRILRIILETFHEGLSRTGIRAPAPQGGFYLLPSFDLHRAHLLTQGIQTDTQLCRVLLNELGIAMLPGQCFGRKPKELMTRMSIVDFDGQNALRLAQDCSDDQVLKSRLERLAPELFEVPSRLANWLQK